MEKIMKMSQQKLMLLTIAFIGCLIHFYFEIFLSYDSSRHLISIFMPNGEDFYVPEGRLSVYLLQLPTVIISKFASFSVSKFVYGLSYSFLPFFALLICSIFKKVTDVEYYASVIGIFLINFLGFHHILSEHFIACLYIWPFYCLLTNIKSSSEKMKISFLLILGIFILFLHQVSLLLFLILLFHLLVERKVLKRNNVSMLIVKLVSVFFFISLIFHSSRFIDFFNNEFSSQRIYQNFDLKLTFLYALGISFLSILFTFLITKKKEILTILTVVSIFILITLGVFNDYSILILSISKRDTFFVGTLVVFLWAQYARGKLVQERSLYFPLLIFCYYTLIGGVKREDDLENITKLFREQNTQCLKVFENDLRSLSHWASNFEYAIHTNDLIFTKCLVGDSCSLEGEQRPFRYLDKEEYEKYKCFN